MLKSTISNYLPGHSHNEHTFEVGLSSDICPGNISKRKNKMKIKKTILADLINAVKNGFDFTSSDITINDLKEMKKWVTDRWENEWLLASHYDTSPPDCWIKESEETLAQINAELAIRKI